MAREDATGVRFLPGEYARFLAAGVLVTYAVVVALGLAFWKIPLTQEFLSGIALLGASLFAAAACFLAWRTLPRAVRRPWLIFGLSGLFASAAHAGPLFGDVATQIAVIHLTWAAAYVLFVGGIVTIIQQSERGRWTELGMDVALLAAAATVVVLRWAPGINETALSSAPAGLSIIVLGPVAAFCASLLVVVLLVSPPASLPTLSSYAIATSTIALTVSALPQVLGGRSCCHAGSPVTIAAIGMWMFLTFAAATAVRAGGQGVVIPQGERLRQFVAPTVAIILAAISMDTSLNPPVHRQTAIALGVLAALVALRLTQLLQATRAQVAERRELAQTRALIEVSRALAGANDLDVTLRTVTDWAQRVLNAKAASIELLSPDRQVLVLRAATGLPQNVIGLTFPVDGSFTGWVVRNGDSRVAANAQRDPFIGPDSITYLGSAPVAAMPLRYRERILGVITCVGTHPFDAADLELLRAFANQAAIALEDARLFEQVRALSVTDALTGLANRRRLDRELEREFAAARRGRKLVAVMFDLDDFKQHNDRFGHLAGDRALKHFADALNTCTRAMNMAARFGGDEFFALLADGDRKGAEVFVQRVRARFEKTMREAGNTLLHVSAGIAEFQPDMNSPSELVEAADRALYISKSEGTVSK